MIYGTIKNIYNAVLNNKEVIIVECIKEPGVYIVEVCHSTRKYALEDGTAPRRNKDGKYEDTSVPEDRRTRLGLLYPSDLIG